MRSTRGLILGMLLVGARAFAAAPDGELVKFPSGDEQAAGFLALPEGAGKHPAIIVIHEWWGLNDWTKDKARVFAKEGYVALAVDLYRGQLATDPDTAHQLLRGLPEDRALRDLRAAVRYLSARPDVDGTRLGSVGWCMGGGYSLSFAIAEPKLSATVIYYGRLVTDDAAIGKIKAQLLGNFGSEDRGIPTPSVEAFVKSAKKAKVNADFKVYPAAGHGFASSRSPEVYKTEAARDADSRTSAFFAKVLKRK